MSSVEDQPRLKFLGVDIYDVGFRSFQPSIGIDAEIKLSVLPGVLFDEKEPKRFKIFMEVNIAVEKYFEMKLKAVGTFVTNIDIDDKTRKLFINQNAPAIMFPYIRSFVTMFTSNLGKVTGSVVLPVQFFKGDMEELKLPDSPMEQIPESHH